MTGETDKLIIQVRDFKTRLLSNRYFKQSDNQQRRRRSKKHYQANWF